MGADQVPMLDLTPEVDELWSELQPVVQAVLRSGHFIMGPNVTALERELAAYLGCKHAITLNSGTDALVIGLRALDIGPGDEVVVPTFTFFATAEAVSQVGATPVFVDVDPATFNIDTDKMTAAVTRRTRAVIPVHLFGHAADMEPVLAVAGAHGLKVLEDVAQAFGGTYRGTKLGSLGDAGAFSFFPSKNLGAYGDGGVLATNDDQTAELARSLRVHGSRRDNKYMNERVGYNSRLDELQAAILRVKLPRVDAMNAGRRRVAQAYGHLLGVEPHIVVPTERSYGHHVYHQYTIRITNGRRDQVRQSLAEQGISTMMYYRVPVHRLPVYQDVASELAVAERLATEVLSLPIWPKMSNSVVERVAASLRHALSD